MTLLREALRGQISRRAAIQAAGIGVGGLAGAALLGCEEEKKSTNVGATPDIVAPTPTILNPTKDTTKEAPGKKEGALSLGNWQLEAQEWEELPYYPRYDSVHPENPPAKQYREGWKFASFKGRLRNVGSRLSSLPQGSFYFSSPDGNKYETWSILQKVTRVPNSYLAKPDFPPGFSDEIKMGGWIPEVQKDYSIKYPTTSASNQDGIRKGEVTKNSPPLSQDVKISDMNTPLIIPNWGSIAFTNEFLTKQGGYDYVKGKHDINNYALLEIKNTTGQDINSGKIVLLILLNNNNYLVAGYQSTVIPPGLNKKVEFVLAGSPGDLDNFDARLKGGTFAAIYDNAHWAAWRIPAK